ncbi:MAG: protein kinase [Myxococcales bacterium]|nr:protein kinase [Myxococcales bacterium]
MPSTTTHHDEIDAPRRRGRDGAAESLAAVGVVLLGQAATAPAEGSGEGSAEVAPPPSLQERFFDDYHGAALITATAVIAVLLVVRKMLAAAGAMSKYGEGLDRAVRVQIKQAENAGNFSAAGDLLFANDRPEEAAELYEKAGDWIRAGEALDKAGNIQKAAASFKKGGATLMAADAFARRKQYQNAAREYLLAEVPERAAECFAKAKDYARAAELFHRADRLREAGECYDRLGDKPMAADLFKAEFERQFDLARGELKSIKEACDLAARAAEYLADAGKAGEAADLLFRAGFKRRAAELYTDIGDVDKAASIYIDANRPMHAAKLYESVGDGKKASRYRAEAKLSEGDKRAAAAEYASAGDFLRAAELYNELRDFEPAADMFDKAGDVRMAADLYRLVGDNTRAAAAYEKAGDFAQAMALYHEAGDFKAELQSAKAANDFFRVGRILLDHGRKEDALAAFQRIDSHDVHFPEASVLQGDILRELGRLDVAFQKYKAAVGDAPPSKANVDILYKMALTAEQAEVAVQALQLFESVIGVDYYYRDASERASQIRQQLTTAGAMRPVLGMSVVAGSAAASVYVDPAGAAAAAAQPASPAVPAAAAAPAAAVAASPAKPEKKRYEVMDEIARGGMGVVFKAKDTVLDRIVAYKLLASNLKTNKVAVKYFLREAQAAAKMAHPNIVTVFDAGEQDGEYYMAMEYVDGQTLKALVNRQGAFPEKLVRYIFVHACRGLQYAHSQGLVHRDIKPGNMMLTRDRALKIMDFGLAKFVEEAAANHTRAIGTPYYMSPEQILGKELDGRTDLYSLGVSMFECATGQVPFSKGDLSYHHLHTDPPRARDLNPNISQELSDIIYKCMAKDPDGRYGSVEELMNVVR